MKVVKNSREQGQTNPPKPPFVDYKYILPVCTSVYLLLVSMFVVVCLFCGFLFFPSASPFSFITDPVLHFDCMDLLQFIMFIHVISIQTHIICLVFIFVL